MGMAFSSDTMTTNVSYGLSTYTVSQVTGGFKVIPTSEWRIGNNKTPNMKIDWGNRYVVSIAGTSGTGKTFLTNGIQKWYDSIPINLAPEPMVFTTRATDPFPKRELTPAEKSRIKLLPGLEVELKQRMNSECPFYIEDVDRIVQPAHDFISFDMAFFGSGGTGTYGQMWVDQSAFFINDYVMSTPDNSLVILCGVLDCGFTSHADEPYSTFMADLPFSEKYFMTIDAQTLKEQTFGRNIVNQVNNPNVRSAIIAGWRVLGTFNPADIDDMQQKDLELYVRERGFTPIPRDDTRPMLEDMVMKFSSNCLIQWKTEMYRHTPVY